MYFYNLMVRNNLHPVYIIFFLLRLRLHHATLNLTTHCTGVPEVEKFRPLYEGDVIEYDIEEKSKGTTLFQVVYSRFYFEKSLSFTITEFTLILLTYNLRPCSEEYSSANARTSYGGWRARTTERTR